MPSATSDNRAVIVLRVGEIFLKGGNRRLFYRQFLKNARRLVADLDGVTVESAYLRAVVHHPPELRRACLERLERLFGLVSMSPAAPVACDLDAITAAAARPVAALPEDATFKIESKRRDKRFPMTSQDVSREVGGRVALATGRRARMREPDLTVRIEIDSDRAFVFSEVIGGPGGLPVGSGGNVALLLSGGIDSPVAGWSAMRRGCHASAVYFHSFPFTGDKTREKVLSLARELARWQGRMAVYVVHFTQVQKALRDHGKPELAVLLYRRMMMRAASRIAVRERAAALVTGENLGQVASQTLENLAVIEDAASLPVLRPLITYDKQEIVAAAQRIGTFETSILPHDDTCSLFVPKHPATRARIGDLRAAEEGLDTDAMADELAANAERVIV
jgi:tRNA uracil 4-sulfurtransferase